MKKINITELLKDCPQGMELDCILFNNTVKYGGLNGDDSYPIEIITETDDYFYITKEGYLYNTPNSKCVIFPKGKTTWEGFQRPFKDGDVVVAEDNESIQLFLLKHLTRSRNDNDYDGYCYFGWDFQLNKLFEKGNWGFERLATEEEKKRLFDAIKANGYKWNPETKSLEKLIEPIFEVGNKIEKCGYRFTIAEVKDDYYLTKCGNKILIDNQDDFSLVPDKFDITTLIPFESRVLVKEDKKDVWQPAFYGFFNQHNKRFYTTSTTWLMCIPYNEETKHLIGTTNDCDEYYKTW